MTIAFYRCAVPALHPPFPALSDGTIRLRAFTMADVPAVTAACQDREISRWTATIPWPYREDDASSWIRTHSSVWAEGRGAPFAIVEGDDALLGSIGLHSVDWDSRTAVAGYWVAAWARRRGVATAALGLVIGWSIETLGLQAVELTTMIGNRASERVAEKAGFRAVGRVHEWEHPGAPGSRFDVTVWRHP